MAAQQAGTPGQGEASPAHASLAWRDLIERVDHAGQLRLAQVMRDWVRVIALAPGELTYSLAPGYSEDPSAELRDALLRATGERWQVSRGEGEGEPTLREIAAAEREAEQAALRRDPMVEAAFAAFPEAELIDEEAETRMAGHGGNRNWSRQA
jgi:DNA polymerase-3 subunit gamma/tau